LELRHLAALTAVADEGSLSGAARRLGYTQPAVSQQIANLERVFGLRLLERPRGPGRATLTEAGRVLLGHSNAVRARLDAAAADLRALQEGAAGTLSVGTIPSAGAQLLPSVLRLLNRVSPVADVRLTESASDSRLLELVERGELDFAFIIMPARGPTFAAQELLSDPYVLAVARSSPHAAKKAFDLNALADTPLIEFGHSQGRIADWLQSRGIEARIVLRSDDNSTVMGLVAEGLGVAILPRLAVQLRRDVRVVPLRPPLEPRRIGLAWHRERQRTPLGQEFLRAAITVGRNISAA
jgi:molybdate transport repressor ModE-like protein